MSNFVPKGCVFHGHNVENPDCPLTKGMLPSSKNPFGNPCVDVYNAWLKKKKDLEDLGFTVVCKWECDFTREKKESEDMQDKLKLFYTGGRPRRRLALRCVRSP